MAGLLTHWLIIDQVDGEGEELDGKGELELKKFISSLNLEQE